MLYTMGQVRASHNKVKTNLNGMQGWIVNADWGMGVRFYPVGVGCPGMIDQVKDGKIVIVEKL